MKIDSAYKPTTPVATPRAATAQAAPKTGAQDAVSLSQLSGSLKASENMPVNTARILEIKQAISEGRFKINPEAIANRLIESARDLVNSNSKREA